MNVPTTAFWLVIPAAGVGRRMGAERPKQYLEVAGRTIIEHTLNRFLDYPGLQGIVVALGEQDPYWPLLACSSDARIERVTGGGERADSVRNALLALIDRAADTDWVLVHDAARPCLGCDDLARLLDALRDHPVGGILATPARDTMKRVNDTGEIEATVDRATLWHAQTPQMFRLGSLLQSLETGAATWLDGNRRGLGAGAGGAAAKRGRRIRRQHQDHSPRGSGLRRVAAEPILLRRRRFTRRSSCPVRLERHRALHDTRAS